MKLPSVLLAIAGIILITGCSVQRRINDQKRLANLILKQCEWRSHEDSTAVFYAVQQISRLYKVKRVLLVSNGTGTNHFIPFFGKMYLNVKDTNEICGAFTKELVHARQFAMKPLYNSWRFLRDATRAAAESFVLAKDEQKKADSLNIVGIPRFIARCWVSWERNYLPDSVSCTRKARPRSLEADHEKAEKMIAAQFDLFVSQGRKRYLVNR